MTGPVVFTVGLLALAGLLVAPYRRRSVAPRSAYRGRHCADPYTVLNARADTARTPYLVARSRVIWLRATPPQPVLPPGRTFSLSFAHLAARAPALIGRPPVALPILTRIPALPELIGAAR